MIFFVMTLLFFFKGGGPGFTQPMVSRSFRINRTSGSSFDIERTIGSGFDLERTISSNFRKV